MKRVNRPPLCMPSRKTFLFRGASGLIVAAVLLGCVSQAGKAGKSITGAGVGLDHATAGYQTATIRGEAEGIKSETLQPNVGARAGRIIDQTDEQARLNKELAGVKVQLVTAGKQAEADAVTITRLQSEARRWFDHGLDLLALLSVVGLGATGMMVAMGNPKAVSMGILFGITLAVSTALVWFGFAFAVGATVLLAAAAVGAVVQIVRHGTALKEVVATVQTTKQELTADAKEKLFGDEGVISKVIQSPTTQAIVARIKDGTK